MPRLFVILALSYVYIGCAVPGPRTVALVDGRVVRVATASPEERAAVVRAAAGPDGTGLARLEVLPPDRDAAGLVAAGRADVAIVYGRGVRDLAPRGDRVRVERAPGWDRVYALWIPPRGRWLADPVFRHWLAATVDRAAMVDLVLDGVGEPARGLLAPGGEPETAVSPSKRPFGAGSLPRLSLLFDEGDPLAVAIAARIKATLGPEGVQLALDPQEGSRLRQALDGGEHALALIAHHPPVADPLLGLLDTLCRVSPPDGPVVAEIARATRSVGRDARMRGASSVEGDLVRDHRLVPLVRAHAWLATASSLRGIHAGPWGEIGVERAEWRR